MRLSPSSSSTFEEEKRIIEFEIQELMLTIRELLLWSYPIDALDYSDSTILHSLSYYPTEYQFQIIEWIIQHISPSHQPKDCSPLTLNVPLSQLIQQETEDERSCFWIARRFPVPNNSFLQDHSQPLQSLLLPLVSGEFLQHLQEQQEPKQQASTDSDSTSKSTDNTKKGSRYLLRRGPHNRLLESQRKDLLRGEHSLSGVVNFLQRIQTKEREEGLSTGEERESTPTNYPFMQAREINPEGSKTRNPRVVVLVGAGISTSAGIPDFRGRNGLYNRSENSQSSAAEAPGSSSTNNNNNVFSLETLVEEPERFYDLVSRMFLPIYDGHIKPTPVHLLLRTLKEKGWLLRCYTQNIDMLETYQIKFKEEGISPLLDDDDLVEAHGSFTRARCSGFKPHSFPSVVNSSASSSSSNCKFRLSMKTTETKCEMERCYWNKIRNHELPLCPLCGSLLRPDVVFFGEPLPEIFHRQSNMDFPTCDLLLVMGTTLLVYPVAGLTKFVPSNSVRVLINNEPSGCFQFVDPCNESHEIEKIKFQPQKEEEEGADDKEGREVKEEMDFGGSAFGNQENKLLSCFKSIRGNSCISTIVPLSNTEPWNRVTYRDVFYKGNCDEGAWEMGRELGVEQRMKDLQKLISN